MNAPTLSHGLKISQITGSNIWAIPRTQLEHLYLYRESTRNLAIGLAFMVGTLVGAALFLTVAGWL